ncbi:MAG TPA: ferredoxin [Pseudonocardia sp.]|jgi:ferredoxin
MRIVVDWDRCTGLGMCEAEAPDLFELQDDGTLEVLDEKPAEEKREELEAACESCPTEALSIAED